MPGDLLSVRAGLITSRDPLGDGGRVEVERRQEPICERPDLAAVVNFNFGVSCGKRDSRLDDSSIALTTLTFFQGVPSSSALKRRGWRR